MSGTLFRVSVMRASCNLAGLNRCSAQIPHAYQVVSGAGEGEHPAHLKDPAMAHFPQQRDRLQPSETLFNALPFPLTNGMSDMLRGASINRTPTGSLKVLCHMRRDL